MKAHPKSVIAGLALMAVACLIGTAPAQIKNQGDEKFIKEAASGGMLEVKLGQLATERAQDQDVRTFGQRMVQDHTKANKELMDVAKKSGVTVSKDLSTMHQSVYDSLKNLKGADFDRAYMKHMVKDHEEAAAEFAKHAKSAQDPAVKDFAARTLPVIEEHKKMAKTTAAKVGAK